MNPLRKYLATVYRATTSVATILAALALAGPAVATFDPSDWNASTPAQQTVVVRDATVWTSDADARVLEDADLLVVDGVIRAVGPDLVAPEGAVEIDASGKHVTAGLIDAHSHIAIEGGVNEGSNITTAEVRIGDVIDPTDVDIYRQLAGGVTTVHLLHGSANSIGGQNAVIKLRWGAEAAGLRMAEAPEGIKFALGENPKGSNFSMPTPRYPQTRQGVEDSIRERFLAAEDYRRAWQEYREALAAHDAWKGRRGRRASGPPAPVPPRRDLQLEALVEILEGTRLVHSHSYRADEIVMLLRLAERFGFRISSLQHVLEGYKVADEIAAHGAGASTFADWWAYKYEVIDAIPYNGAILWQRGVVTSFNSDDADLARRLNLEAAKAVRYGDVPEADALQFVTRNPALQLGIERWVGSLEAGKHGDFVIWSGHPLSTYSRVEQTWLDGRRFFDRAADLEARERIAAERQELLQAVRDARASEDAEASEETVDDAEASGDPPDHADPPDDPESTEPEGEVR